MPASFSQTSHHWPDVEESRTTTETGMVLWKHKVQLIHVSLATAVVLFLATLPNLVHIWHSCANRFRDAQQTKVTVVKLGWNGGFCMLG